LIDAASIAAAGNTSQTHKTGAANKRRIISALRKWSCGDKRFAARKFLPRGGHMTQRILPYAIEQDL
jgi:hypothetical protein